MQNARGLYAKLVLPNLEGEDISQFLDKVLHETQKVVETLNTEYTTERITLGDKHNVLIGSPRDKIWAEYTMSDILLTEIGQIKHITDALLGHLQTHNHTDLRDLPINVTELTLEALLVNKIMVGYYALLFILIVHIMLLAAKEK